MLTVSPLRSTKYGNQGAMESFSIGNCDFADLSDGNLLESINFDDLFVGFNVDGDVLPDLEMDSDMLAEFSVSCGEESEMNSSASVENNTKAEDKSLKKKVDEDKTTSSSHGSGSSLGEEIVSKRDESVVSKRDESKGRKSSSQTKNQQGKRKVKVDWTPELHRRFVQAVEQLGVDKAVPSRILEIMGIDCLTRHNIASHLQKYRSHRKHLLAREAEAASWNQRRQLYGVTATGGGGGGKREVSPWPVVAPTMGFPPMTTMHHFRSLHVWGHPSMPMWPKHAPHSQPPPPPQPLHWAPAATPQPPQDPALWHSQHQRPPSAIISAGAACFPQPRTTARFGCPPVPGIPRPQTMYKAVDHGIGAPGPLPGPFFDFHPSKESIDAAIGDVLSKPWLPLPLGLKAPALDSVMGELHKQGISNIPPSCA